MQRLFGNSALQRLSHFWSRSVKFVLPASAEKGFWKKQVRSGTRCPPPKSGRIHQAIPCFEMQHKRHFSCLFPARGILALCFSGRKRQHFCKCRLSTLGCMLACFDRRDQQESIRHPPFRMTAGYSMHRARIDQVPTTARDSC